MTQTYTTTETWSRTHARYIAGKVAADLRQMQQEYGKPTDEHLNDLVEELVSYLADDYLDYIEYGFRRGDTWVVAHRYTASQLGSSATDDRSGRIRRGADTTGAYWSSMLVTNSRFANLSQAERDRYEAGIKIKRNAGSGATPSTGTWAQERSYSSGGGSVSRAGCGGNS
jgi:hypothetical protein